MNSTNRRQQNYGSDVSLSYFIDWLKEDLKKPLTLYYQPVELWASINVFNSLISTGIYWERLGRLSTNERPMAGK